jgi:hypothetical protein
MDWELIVPQKQVPASGGLWTLVHEFVEGPALLSIRAIDWSMRWSPAWPIMCNADGDPTSLMSRKNCLVSGGIVGALVGKIGGSSASATDGTTFMVGRACVVKVSSDGGPLYLGINDEPSGMWNNGGDQYVNVYRCALPPPPEDKPKVDESTSPDRATPAARVTPEGA